MIFYPWVFKAIRKVLYHKQIQFPVGRKTLDMANQYMNERGFRCIGAIDGTHQNISTIT